MANISYIKLLQAVELFSSEHMQVKRFASDFPAQMPNFGTENEKYPILFVSPNTNIFDENVNIFTIDIYCFDIIQKDRSNINTILSDTNLILSDLHRWLLDGEIFGIDINTQVTTTPIDNALLDYAAGWRMTATFDVDTYAICEIPFVNEPVILMEVNDVVYTTSLTCDTLADCDTFTNAIDGLQTQIDNIELIPGPTGSQGATGPQGATGTSLLQNITPDSYLGLRLTPIDGTTNGFYINKSVNGAVGYYVRNTENVGNGSVSEISVGGTGSLYENYASLFHANNGYYIPYLRGKSGLISNDDFYFIGWQGASFDFRTGNGSYGTETSKFAISNSGTVSIGIQPVLDNTITDILGRKSDGSIVRVSKSSLGAVTSVGLSMSSAFTVTNSPITGSGSISVTGAGSTAQYIRGDGTLGTTVTKTSELINDGDNGTSHFISLEDLPSTLTLYPTTATSSIGGYNKLVSSITDTDYNSTAVDVSTGAITGTDQLIAGLITEPNQIIGNPGVFNMTTIGNIRKTTGSGQAEFFFRVYKRDAGGTETLILQSNNTQQITTAIYAEFFTSGLWNDGVFISTDRIVIKFYGTKVGGGSDPTYDFQFGGTAPIRSIVPVPLNVVAGLNNIRRHSFTNYNPGVGYSLDYNGYAPQGSLESANVWTITRLTINAFGISTSEYAVNVAWTDRATVIYT